jgi:hypothetical protein
VIDPHSGGSKIPEAVQRETTQRLLASAEKRFKRHYARLDIRYKGQFCYVDAYQEPDPSQKPYLRSGETVAQARDRLRNTPIHLCRLRYCGPHRGPGCWSLGFYTYSHEKYEPCAFRSGEMYGTVEEGLDVADVYLER